LTASENANHAASLGNLLLSELPPCGKRFLFISSLNLSCFNVCPLTLVLPSGCGEPGSVFQMCRSHVVEGCSEVPPELCWIKCCLDGRAQRVIVNGVKPVGGWS